MKAAVLASKIARDFSGLCIYATGSYGRLEASNFSDLDLFLIHSGSRENSPITHSEQDTIKQVLSDLCGELGFPPFTDDGLYLKIHHLQDILDVMGSPEDDYQNYFTARMLLLLESVPVYNEEIYNSVMESILGAYYRDYHDHEKDFQPIFLTNDIQRFWRTLCLNWEHKRNRPLSPNGADKNKAHLNNLKLKFSRIMTCYSMIARILSLKSEATPHNILTLIHEAPIDRFHKISRERVDSTELIDRILQNYAWFLTLTNQPKVAVLDWISNRDNRDLAFKKGRALGQNIYDLISISLIDKQKLRYLVV